VSERRDAAGDRVDLGAETAVEHERPQAGVHEQRLELPGGVAEVHVDRDSADLERGEHDLHVLAAVEHQDPDRIASPEPRRHEMVSEPVGAPVELGEGQRLAVPHDDGGAVADPFDDKPE